MISFDPLRQDVLRELFYQDDEMGWLRWRNTSSSNSDQVVQGMTIALVRTPRGRQRVRFGGISVPAETVIWMISTGDWPEVTPKHRNRKYGDIRFANLYLGRSQDHQPYWGRRT